MKLPFAQSIVRIVVTYVLFAGLWILFSDRILDRLAPDAALHARWSLYKGWAFVIVTGSLLAGLLRRELLRRGRVETELQRTNRALRTISECNQLLVRAPDEQTLLDGVCRLLVEHGGYRMAWVGFAEQDAAKSVRPVAQAGFEAGYLDTVNITWADTERGRGPTGTAIRTGQPVLARNIPSDPAYGPWRAAAIQRGYASSIALPLTGRDEGRGGALMVYAAEPEAFDAAEMALLSELTDDLTYGLSVLRGRETGKLTEAALRESNAFNESLLQTVPFGMDIVNEQGRILFLNAALERAVGPQAIGKFCWQIYKDDQLQCADCPLKQPIHVGETRVIETVGALGGKTFEVNHTGIVYRGEKVILEVFYDITERTKARAAQARQRAELQLILDSAPAFIFLKDRHHRIVRVNREFCRLLGVSREAIEGHTSVEFGSPCFQQFWRDDEMIFTTGQPRLAVVEPLVTPSGTRWLRTDKLPIPDAAGNLVGIVSFSVDITERKQVEAALLASENRLRLVWDHALVPLRLTDADGVIVMANPAYRELVHKSRAELEGHSLAVVYAGEDRERIKREYADRFAGRTEFGQGMVNATFWDGRAVVLEVAETFFDAPGDVRLLLTATRDITERQRAEAALKKLNRSLKALSDSNQALIRATDEAGLLHAVCDIVVQTGQYRMVWVGLAGDDEARSVRIAAHAGAAEGYLESLHLTWADEEHGRGPTGTAIRTGQPCVANDIRTSPQFPILRAEAAQRGYASAAGLPLRAHGQMLGALTVYASDVDAFSEEELRLLTELADDLAFGLVSLRERAERVKAEAALRGSESLYHSLVENLQQSVFRKDRDGRFTFANQRFCDGIGRPLREVLGLSDFDLFPRALAAKYRRDDDQIMRSRRAFEAEETHQRGDGRERTVHVIKTPLCDAQGEVMGVQGIFWDVTERKQLEAQFLRAQRLESVGQLAGGIAHDLNNVLTPILMSAQLLRRSVQDPEGLSLVDTVETCAQRGADIIKQILTFARGTPGARVALPVRRCLREMEKLIRETFPRNLQLRIEVSAEVWPLLADVTQFHQALLNLCVNARDAMPAGGTLTLAAENVTLEPDARLLAPDAKPGAYVRVSVKDTGTGIPADHLERIFDPFFTTKEPGKGTGLGLASVLGIVRGHGGFVRVESRTGQGTAFDVYLPAAREAQASAPAERESTLPRGHGELVLVVDDEAGVRGVAKRILENHGYQVVCAAEGREALELFARHRATLKAALTDLMMPGMDGRALVRELRRLEPRLPILGMTGAADRSAADRVEDLQLSASLSKPFTQSELLHALQRMLEAGALAGAAPPAI